MAMKFEKKSEGTYELDVRGMFAPIRSSIRRRCSRSLSGRCGGSGLRQPVVVGVHRGDVRRPKATRSSKRTWPAASSPGRSGRRREEKIPMKDKPLDRCRRHSLFLGFLMGYSVPPFIEIGIVVGKGKTVPARSSTRRRRTTTRTSTRNKSRSERCPAAFRG